MRCDSMRDGGIKDLKATCDDDRDDTRNNMMIYDDASWKTLDGTQPRTNNKSENL
jgi:hypothetical protein